MINKKWLENKNMASAGEETVVPKEYAEYILMDTEWNQASYSEGEFAYNKYCPYIMVAGKPTSPHSVTGCVNTMSGQIVYYWIQKYGYELDLTLDAADSYVTSKKVYVNTYQHNEYGYASFASINSMLANFTVGADPNSGDDIAALCFALGVKSEADYGYASGTSTTLLIGDVFKEIGFVSANEINHEKHNYFYQYDEATNAAPVLTNDGWEIIKDQMTNKLVMGCMIYKGEAEQHAIVIDGYYADKDLIHLNFGWGNYQKVFVEEEGRYEGNGWYTRAEFEALRPAYFLADLYGTPSNKSYEVTSNKVYGVGALNRVIEQVNGLNNMYYEGVVGKVAFKGAASNIVYNNSVFELKNSVTVQDFHSDITVDVADGDARMFWSSSGKYDMAFGGSMRFTVRIEGSKYASAFEGRNIVIAGERAWNKLTVIGGEDSAYGFRAYGGLQIKDLAVSAQTLISSEKANAYAFSGSNSIQGSYGGLIIANSELTAYAFRGDKLDVVLNGAKIFAGQYKGNFSTYQAATSAMAQTLTGNSQQGVVVPTAIMQAANGYAFYAADYSDDTITVSNGSIIMGNWDLRGGSDKLVVSSDSQIFGDIDASDLDLVFQIGHANGKAVINSSDVSTLLNDTSYSIDLNKAADGTYILINSQNDISGLNKLKFAVDFHDVVYSVKIDDTFSAYDFVDINVIDNQLSLSVQNLLNGAGGLTVTQSTTALTNQDVILKVDYSSNYKELRYSIDGGRSYHTYKASEGIVMKENGEIKFQMIALNGEIGEASYFVKNIDKEPPAVPSISPSTTAFTRNDVILTVSFAEDAVIKEFSRDGITWRPMLTNKLTVNENSTVLFRCFDEAGNMSMSEYTVTNIDGGGPVKPIITLSETAPTNQDVVVTAKFSGYSLSDSYSLNGTLWRPYIGPVTMSKNGVVYFRSIDEEGMVATASVNVTNIDRKAPGKPKVQTVVFNDWTTEVVVTATFAADSVRNEYSTDGVNYKLYSGPISCLSNTKLYFRCVDAAGNYSKVATRQVKRSKWVVSDEVLTVEDSFANTISAANTGDSYAFEVTAGKYTIDGEFGLNLTAKVFVRDSSGKLRLQGNIRNGVLDIDAKLLEKGKYTLTVDRTKNGYGDYTLDVKGVAYTQGNNSDDAWNSSYVQSNVRSVGALESGKSEKLAASEWVGFGDAQDYIKLDVQYDGEYSFQVTDLSNNVKLTVYEDRDGKLKKVKSASIKKKASGSLSGVELDSDSTYYLLLEATGAKKGLNTDYELEISASYQDIVEDILYGAESFKTFDLAAGDNLTGDLLDDKNQGMLA